jgi:hypothetical protein
VLTVLMLVFSVFYFTFPVASLAQGSSEATVTGSTGKVDELDLNEYEVRNQFATIKDSVANGTVIYRYNLVSTDNFGDCPGCTHDIRIRYRDAGPNQKVIVRLIAADTIQDGVFAIYTFDSDTGDGTTAAPPNSAANQTVNRTFTAPGLHIQFGRFVYLVEVEIRRTANDGTPSPGFTAFTISRAIAR